MHFIAELNYIFITVSIESSYISPQQTAISLAGHNLSAIESSFQDDLASIERLSHLNKKNNVVKQKAMAIFTKQKTSKIYSLMKNQPFSYTQN